VKGSMHPVILQTAPSYEVRTIRSVAMLRDEITVVNSSIEALPSHKSLIDSGALPVGSVEFVRHAMEIGGIKEPENLSYPEKSKKYWHRNIRVCKRDDIVNSAFVKPVKTKLFTGFCYYRGKDISQYSEHDQEQLRIFMSENTADELMYVSDIVSWQNEWRYYVMNGKIVGSARYDDLEIDDIEPNQNVVNECINDLDIIHPYAIDFGVMNDGTTALVEVNDAWAIGLYRGAMSGAEYLDFLSERWKSVVKS